MRAPLFAFALLAVIGAAPAHADVLAPVAAVQPPDARSADAKPTDVKPVATLKQVVRVPGRIVTLGDLFDNAGPRAGEEVATAPAPGGSLVLDAEWLVSTAQSHGIVWHPPSVLTNIRVERTAIALESADIEKAVSAAAGLDRPDRRVLLDSRARLYAPEGDTPHIEVSRLEIDQDTGRLKADVKVSGDDPTLRTITVYGRIESMVSLPVLTRTVTPGETIEPSDLSTEWVRVELAPAAALADNREIVGHTPRRPLRAGQPLRPGDVEIPVVVKRNDLVLIVLEQPGLYLTAQGKALEDGGVGAAIRVMNTQSNRSIDAVVDGTGQVSVRLAGPQTAAY